MKCMLTFAMTAVAVMTYAQEPAKGGAKAAVDAKLAELSKKAEVAERQANKRAEAERRPEVLKKTGGFVDVVAEGTAVLVVDARPKSGGAPDQFREVFENLSKTKVVVEKIPLADGVCPIETIRGRLAVTKAVYALMVVDSEKMAGVTVLPEDRVAVINAAKYKEGTDPVRREERIHKEIWRSLGFVSGLGYAPYPNDVLQPVFSVSELDALEYQVMQPMNFQKMYATMKKFGATRARHIPYRLAVMEGWAPAPTNEYQKAIWDKVHALPQNPMKIEFDPKKGR